LVQAYETIRRERSKFLHELEAMSVMQTMFPPGRERNARDLDLQKRLHAGQYKWDDDVYLGLWGQLYEIWAYNAFDVADDWWVQWGMLRERALSLQISKIEVPFNRLEISVGIV
jgi:salicylate hydroxylase